MRNLVFQISYVEELESDLKLISFVTFTVCFSWILIVMIFFLRRLDVWPSEFDSRNQENLRRSSMIFFSRVNYRIIKYFLINES